MGSYSLRVRRVMQRAVLELANLFADLLHGVRADLYRMSCTRGCWVAFLLPTAATVARIGFARLGHNREIARRLAQELPVSDGFADANGFGPLADGLRTGGAVLALIALIMGALLMVRERESGALGLLLVRRRWAILVGKGAVLFTFLIMTLAFMFAAGTAMAGTLFDLGPIVEDGFEMATAGELWTDTLKALASSIPAFCAAGSFGLLLSSITSTTGAAVAATLVPFVLFDLLQGFLGPSARFLFVRYVPFLGDSSTLVRLTEVSRAYNDAGWEAGELYQATLYPALAVAVFLFIAAFISRSRSV